MDEREAALLNEATKRADELGWRLALAQKFAGLLTRAYDALQAYGIDYRKLHTYPLFDKIVPEGNTYDNPSAREAIAGWITRVHHDLDAAIRRKTGVKLAVDNGPDPENGI